MVTDTKEKIIELLPGQADILTNFTANILAAIAGCVAGDTLIDTLAGSRPINEILGFNDVLAMTDEGIKSAPAFIFCKGKAQLYRLTLDNGKSVEATADHYLLVSDGQTLHWRSVGELLSILSGQNEVLVVCVELSRASLAQHEGYLPDLVESSLVSYLLTQLSGVHHLSHKAQDCQGHCSGYSYPYGQQLLRGKDNDRQLVPLSGGVHGYNHRQSERDDQGTSRECNLPYQSFVPHAKNNLVPLPDHEKDEGYYALPLPCGLSQGLSQEPLLSHKWTYGSRLPASLDGLFQPVSNSFGVPYRHLQSLLSHTLNRIVEIEPTTIASYYDMVVPDWHNYLAQGMVHHNTGGGKTVCGYWWLHSRMEAYPGQTWGLAEPTFPLLSKVILTSSDPDRPSLEQYFRQANHHPDYHAVDKIMFTDFGKVYLGSADNPDSMQGAALKGYWLDEAGLMKLQAYETARQRVAMMNGQVLITTTPYNSGWLKTEVADKADGNEIVVKRWRSIDRPGFPVESYEREKRRLPPWRFAMMYDARFERPAGLIYSAFNELTCLIDRFPLPKEWLRYVGHDFGGANPAATFYAQDPATGYFYAYYEYLPGAGRSTAQHVEEFKKITGGTNVIKRAGGSHQEDEIRQGYTAHGWPIQEPKIHKVEAQLDKVIGLHQLNKLFVFNDLRNYLDEKRSFSRKLDANYNPTEEIEDEQEYHLMAAERYILSDFTPETVTYRGPVTVTSRRSR